MSTKWKTGGYGENRIEAVECVTETAKQVVIRFKSSGFGGGSYYDRRMAKSSAYDCYHDTWDEAKAHLIQKAEANLLSARYALQCAQDELGNVKGLKPKAEA